MGSGISNWLSSGLIQNYKMKSIIFIDRSLIGKDCHLNAHNPLNLAEPTETCSSCGCISDLLGHFGFYIILSCIRHIINMFLLFQRRIYLYKINLASSCIYLNILSSIQTGINTILAQLQCLLRNSRWSFCSPQDRNENIFQRGAVALTISVLSAHV